MRYLHDYSTSLWLEQHCRMESHPLGNVPFARHTPTTDICQNLPLWKMIKHLGSQTPLLKAGTDQGDPENHPEQNSGACASHND